MDYRSTQCDLEKNSLWSDRRATTWQLRSSALEVGSVPLIMGIINATPDSFSDGGRFYDAGRAVEQALQLVEEGADIIDIGGESTRPYATPVDQEEEIRRIEPVVRAVCRQTKIPVSIDTSKAAVACVALDAGAEIINDITGLVGDEKMIAVACDSNAGVCAMHMQGNPQTMQDDPQYENVVDEIVDYLRMRFMHLLESGVERTRICLDPGIGFGKTHEHNIELLAHASRFLDLAQPVLIGHSRKGFIGKVLDNKKADRTAANIGIAMSLARQGIQVLRVHDVQPVRQALQLFAVTGGLSRLGKAME